MLNFALKFVLQKLFSPSAIFIIPVVGAIAFILIWNFETIADKIGYKTKDGLMAEVATLEEEKRSLLIEQGRLNRLILTLNDNINLGKVSVEKYDQKVDENTVKQDIIISAGNESRDKVLNADKDEKELEIKTVEDKLSEINISTIHDAYDTFFGEKV